MVPPEVWPCPLPSCSWIPESDQVLDDAFGFSGVSSSLRESLPCRLGISEDLIQNICCAACARRIRAMSDRWTIVCNNNNNNNTTAATNNNNNNNKETQPFLCRGQGGVSAPVAVARTLSIICHTYCVSIHIYLYTYIIYVYTCIYIYIYTYTYIYIERERESCFAQREGQVVCGQPKACLSMLPSECTVAVER